MDDDLSLDEALEELSSAEDFLDYFGVAFDEKVVHVNRLHILQRFHDYMARQGEIPGGEEARTEAYRRWLTRAYEDFVHSDALTQKVFRVFQTVPNPEGGHTAFVPLERIFQDRS